MLAHKAPPSRSSPSGRRSELSGREPCGRFRAPGDIASLLESMQKIAILYDASKAVLSTVDLDEVLNQILTIVRDYFQLQNGSVLLVDAAKQELFVRAHLGHGKTELGYRVRLDQGLTGAAARLKRPIYAPDVSR